MNWFGFHAMSQASVLTMAQVSVERFLNALPEGLLIALFAWALLRVLRKQNSGTRFAVWFLALLMVAALPLLGIGSAGKVPAPGMAWGHLHPAITIPGSWAIFVFAAWALGVLVAMARLVVGLWQLRQLRRSCTAIAAAELDPSVRKTVEALGAASKPLMIATSDEVRVPSAIGFWNRTIVLPVWALRELSPEDLNVILLHESAHLRRGDDWTNLIQKIVRAVFFFHPAVWWIESQLSVEREMACDDAVLAETSNPHGYANCLVSLLEKSLAHRLEPKRWSLAQAAVHRAREASLRLAQILDRNRPVATRVWKPALGVVAVFSMVCLAVLPHAPQFVAFDRSMAPSIVDHVDSARANWPAAQPSASQSSASQPSMTAAVIPAALRTGDLLSGGPAGMSPAKVIHAHTVAKRQFAPARAIDAHWTWTGKVIGKAASKASGNKNVDVNALSAQVVQTGAKADDEFAPQFQTLVFIQVEATPYVAYGSPVWRVQVWQVTFVSTLHERMLDAQAKSAPASNSI
jgi:beta-lactamase regulating signal transducer with metallopeptidase domain